MPEPKQNTQLPEKKKAFAALCEGHVAKVLESCGVVLMSSPKSRVPAWLKDALEKMVPGYAAMSANKQASLEVLGRFALENSLMWTSLSYWEAKLAERGIAFLSMRAESNTQFWKLVDCRHAHFLGQTEQYFNADLPDLTDERGIIPLTKNDVYRHPFTIFFFKHVNQGRKKSERACRLPEKYEELWMQSISKDRLKCFVVISIIQHWWRNEGESEARKRFADDKALIGFSPSSRPVDERFIHAPDYSCVTISGRSFTLTPKQATIIQLLHKAHESNVPFVTLDRIKDELRISDDRWMDYRLEHSFQGRNGKEVFSNLVLRDRPGVFRLNI